MTDSCAKREQNPHYGLYNGLKASPGDQRGSLQSGQQYPFRKETYDVFLFKLGEGAANRFQLETKEISNILTSHRQGHGLRIRRRSRQTVAPIDKEDCHLLFGRAVAEQAQLVLGGVHLARGELDQ